MTVLRWTLKFLICFVLMGVGVVAVRLLRWDSLPEALILFSVAFGAGLLMTVFDDWWSKERWGDCPTCEGTGISGEECTSGGCWDCRGGGKLPYRWSGGLKR